MEKQKISRKEYKALHTKKNYRHFNVYINRERNKKVIDKLESVDSIASYICELVRNDIKK